MLFLNLISVLCFALNLVPRLTFPLAGRHAWLCHCYFFLLYVSNVFPIVRVLEDDIIAIFKKSIALLLECLPDVRLHASNTSHAFKNIVLQTSLEMAFYLGFLGGALACGEVASAS